MIVAAIIAPEMRTRVSQNIMCGSSPVSGVSTMLFLPSDVFVSPLLSFPAMISSAAVLSFSLPAGVSFMTLTVPDTSLDESSSGVPALLLCALTKHSPPGENCEFCYKDETNCDIMDTINRKQGCARRRLTICRTAGDDNLSIAE